MKLAEAIAKQEKALEALKKTNTNMRKKGLRKGNIESYLKGLEARWAEIRALDADIEKVKSSDNAALPYFNGWLEEADEEFLEQRGLLLDALHECEAAANTPSEQNNASMLLTRTHYRKLPHMELPKFSGNYTQWASFKDLFQSMTRDGDLTDVDRLQYLKASLSGEAAQLIKNLPVTSENYARAWRKLTEQYENTRLIVNSCLNSLLQMQPLLKESEQGLNALKGTTNDVIEILTALKRPVQYWDDFLVYLTVQRLDPKSRRDWETSVANSTAPSTYKELEQFLISRIQALKSIEHGQDSLLRTMASNTQSKAQATKPSSGKVSAHNTFQPQTGVECKYCGQGHYIASCDSFKALDVSARKDFITNNRLCYNCLGAHGVRDCRSKKTCYQCHGRHHKLLHFLSISSKDKAESNITVTPQNREMPQEDEQINERDEQPVTVHTASAGPSDNRGLILMATAQVIVTANGRKVLLRALIDPCSDASFIRESMVQLIGAQKRPASIPVGGIGGGISQLVRSKVSVQIASRTQTNFNLTVSALVLSKLTDYLPPRHCIPMKLEFLKELDLADPHYSSDVPIDMILGLDVYTHIILPGLRKNTDSNLIAQETTLGWLLSGKYLDSPNAPTVKCLSTVTNEELLCALNKFWEQEEIPGDKISSLTQEEIECENHYVQTVQRNSDGRYILRLPFNDKVSQLADSYNTAERMLLRMEKRFASDENFFKLYRAFIDEYIQLGHAEYVDPSELVGKKTFYLPHHGVLKGSGKDAKIRVVFNGSVQLTGHNLNNCLYAGSKLLQELRDVIQLWRLLRYVWTADIVKMFRQILIGLSDQYFLLILWREHPKAKIRIIRLCTVTYGLICAPYQALRTLKQLWQDEGHKFPRAQEVIEKRSYMDDSYGGANSLEEAKIQQEQFSELLRAGGFQLDKWAANNSQLLENVQSNNRAQTPCSIDDTEVHSVLGLVWYPAVDMFTYRLDWSTESSPNLTKRKVLAQAAKLYDPLGWISPIIITFKIFLQSLWTMGVQWDDPIPEQRAKEWGRITEQLTDLSQISIPRHVGNTESHAALELHGFSDASEKAMAAVIYLRVRTKDSRTTCNILVAKTRVAPLKQVSLPRLELNAAFMLAKLVENQVAVLSMEAVPKFLWSDSTVALSWIQGHPTRWTTYVANRVTSIGKAVPDATWLHVAGSLNPADLASRGTDVHGLLRADYWIKGPEFLRDTREPWRADTNFSPLEQCPEERRTTHVVAKSRREWDLIKRYSSLDTLLKVTARCQQFASTLRQLIDTPGLHNKRVLEREREVGVIRPEQIRKAELFWVRHVQGIYFEAEMKALANRSKLSKSSKILKLHPYIDEEGLLRLSGRLKNAMLEEETKHPLILPKDSTFSQLLIRDVHLRTLHGGTQQVLNTLRQRYWVVNGRSAVKKIVSSCVICWKQKPATSTQLMGDLPAPRVRPARPFLHAGVDYAGPIALRMSKGRGVKSIKGYIVIFVCFATRAVHLEVASDYSSEEFIAVYKRFAGRRGISATLYSDCGTNFVGANRQLQELFRQAGACDKKIAEDLLKFRTEWKTEWKFNPPGAPHFGGLWEAGVKMVKFHLKRVLGEAKLTFEELTTLLTQIEACLNSRPLQPISDDPTDLSMLTPGHFLVGAPLNLLPEPSLLDINNGRLNRWQLVRKMTEDFWKAWSLHYLQSLQLRNKWTDAKPNVRVGDICKVKVETMMPCRWPLGRIIKVNTGSDGHVRVVTIQTSTSTFDRPIGKVCLLPIADNYSSMIDEGGRNGEN